MKDDVKPLQILTNDAAIAAWNNDGLPTDLTSIQNGAVHMPRTPRQRHTPTRDTGHHRTHGHVAWQVMTLAKRWPLMIDPQLQGINWIKTKEAKANFKIVQQSQPKYLDMIENAISNGEPIMVECLPEDIDAVKPQCAMCVHMNACMHTRTRVQACARAHTLGAGA